LNPLHRTWSTYRSDNTYEFYDLSDGTYNLHVRAKDSAELTSLPLEYTFTVKGFHKLPQTAFIFEGLGRGKIVGRIPEICWQSGPCSNNRCLYSYKLDNGDWTEFNFNNCFELPISQSARHSFEVIAKNECGIETMPAKHEFDFERIHDLPIVKLTSKPSKVVAQKNVFFTFEGQDDQDFGDKTLSEELLYSWRLIPIDHGWKHLCSQKKVSYNNLHNGTYFFQVKVVDKSGNECVVPAEQYFEINVIPIHQKPLFYWTTSICSIFLVASLSIYFTRQRTRQSVYEQRYNPYVVGEAVHDPEMFFGRDRLIRDLFESLKNNSLCLTGERRIGKTTLLEHLERNVKKPDFAFFCSLEGVKEELFFSRIMQHLTNKLNSIFRDCPTGLILFHKERLSYDEVDFENDIETIIGWLRIKYDPQASIIMCLDEIDATQRFSNDIHSNLRNIFQTYQGKIRLVAAGVSIQRGEWTQPTSPWYNFFEFKSVIPLDSQSAKNLIIKPVKEFYKYDSNSVDFILEKTNHKPFYIQKLCKKIISKILDEKRITVTLNDANEVYNDLIRLELNREFETFWEQLSSGLRYLIILAANGKSVIISKVYQTELLNNSYNHGHKVISISDSKIEFSTIFLDWLDINYVKNEGKTV
ncbi:triple tyrosine motif-containing protein, partial [Desulfosarcina cetonica]|uniref:triple tyrosine motif-containing protein n=1 Tax=Desulfosarcina cetonica TaxID=90730 RepID=UPI0012ED486C